jgi:hypothetical protein
MNTREKLAFAMLAAVAISSSGLAYGQTLNTVNSNQVIYACVTGVNGNIIRVSNTLRACPRGTSPISWNSVGPKGDQGIPGTAVEKGDKGDKGVKGDPGDRGEKGEDGQWAMPTGFMVSPDRNKYPIYLGQALQPAIFVDGMELRVIGDSTQRPYVGAHEIWGGFDSGPYFSTTNCSGKMFGVIDPSYTSLITTGMVYWPGIGGRTFILSNSNVSATQIKSSLKEGKCISGNFGLTGSVYEELPVSLSSYSEFNYEVVYPSSK